MTPTCPARAWTDLGVLSVLLSLLGVIGYETLVRRPQLPASQASRARRRHRVRRRRRPSAARRGHEGAPRPRRYFLFGSPLHHAGAALFGVLPSLASLAGLALGAVCGWADIVTICRRPSRRPTTSPSCRTSRHGWSRSSARCSRSRWLPAAAPPRARAVLLIGPVLLFLSGILLGTDEAFFAGVRGVAFAAIALVWLAWRRGAHRRGVGRGREATAAPQARRHGRSRRGGGRDRRRRRPRARPDPARSLRAARRDHAAVRPPGVREPARRIPRLHEGPGRGRRSSPSRGSSPAT